MAAPLVALHLYRLGVGLPVGSWKYLWSLESVDVWMLSTPFAAKLRKQQRWVELAGAVELALEFDAR